MNAVRDEQQQPQQSGDADWRESRFQQIINRNLTMTPIGIRTEEVLDELEKKVEFFQNSKLGSMVRIAGDGFQQDWPVRSERFLDLLSAIFFRASKGYMIKKTEQNFLLGQIREKCREGKRRFSECEAEDAEANLIVQGLLYFMNDQERFEGRLVDLLEILRDSEIAESFPQQESIPKSTRVFSQRLRRLIPVLNGYGVEVTIEHRKTGSYCLIFRTESFLVETEELLKQGDAGDASDARKNVASPFRHPLNTEYD